MQRVIAVGLVLAAFWLSAFVSERVFERLPHLEDELAYLYQARVFARGDVTVPTPEPGTVYWQPFVVDYEGQRFSKYTPGWSAVLALGVWMGQPWIVNALLGALAVALVYRTGEDIYNGDVGLLAAALLTTSPMFLLLGGSLMGHTLALACTVFFTYAYWRLEKGRRGAAAWGIGAGLALGLLVVARPLTAIGVAAPFIVYSGGRLLWTLLRERGQFWARLRPLLLLSAGTLLLAPAVPLYSAITTGDPLLNPYTLVWEYDRVGFGADRGRNGHTLQEGLRTTRYDLTVTAADLFGWQWGRFNQDQRNHLLTSSSAYPGRGLSWLLLPVGVLIGLVQPSPRRRWTVILLAVSVALVVLHVGYWVGSQRYSTRYYFEGIGAAALLSAVPLGMLAARGRIWRWGVYAVLAGVIALAAANYTIPRLSILRGFNGVNAAVLDAVNERRQTERPLLVILSGDGMTWRANGTLMTVTGPYLDTDIVLARDRADGRYREAILDRFPGREVIDMEGEGSRSWFAGED